MQLLGSIEESLPLDIREAYRLPGIGQALEMVHFPTSPEDVKHGRRRFVYEELLMFQLKMLGMKKARKEAEQGVAVDYEQYGVYVRVLRSVSLCSDHRDTPAHAKITHLAFWPSPQPDGRR